MVERPCTPTPYVYTLTRALPVHTCSHTHSLCAHTFSYAHTHSLRTYSHIFPVHTCPHTGFCTCPPPHVLTPVPGTPAHAARSLEQPGPCGIRAGRSLCGDTWALPARAGGAPRSPGSQHHPPALPLAPVVRQLRPGCPSPHPCHWTRLCRTQHSAPAPPMPCVPPACPPPRPRHLLLAPGCWRGARGHWGGPGRLGFPSGARLAHGRGEHGSNLPLIKCPSLMSFFN